MSNDPYALPESLSQFALIPRIEDQIEGLADMSDAEDWEYHHTPSEVAKPILRNFMKYTYKRIAEEKKVTVSPDEDFACWNTGLITENQEPIYILFEKNKFDNRTCYWHFWKFARKGQWELNRFPVLPEMAHYYEDPSQLVYDTRLELRPNIEHIIEDNLPRFPEPLQTMGAFGVQNILKGSIDSAVERAKRNYKTAIPQYFNGTIQLLLPLSLTDPKKADLALVVEKFSGFYRASTCLTLDMAYNNARQLARPDRDWLQP
jgi:hypothetical protein